jgi:hypothetical protein
MTDFGTMRTFPAGLLKVGFRQKPIVAIIRRPWFAAGTKLCSLSPMQLVATSATESGKDAKAVMTARYTWPRGSLAMSRVTSGSGGAGSVRDAYPDAFHVCTNQEAL